MAKKISKPEKVERTIPTKKSTEDVVNEVPDLKSELKKKMDDKREYLLNRRKQKIEKIKAHKKSLLKGKTTKRK
jgi:hypothetical protein